MRHAGKLVLVAAADEAESPDHVELPGVEQVHAEAPRLVDHVVAVVELVDVDRQPRNRGDDGGADGGVQDHAVLLAAASRRHRYDWRGQIAQELVGQAGFEHNSRCAFWTTSARHVSFPKSGKRSLRSRAVPIPWRCWTCCTPHRRTWGSRSSLRTWTTESRRTVGPLHSRSAT